MQRFRRNVVGPDEPEVLGIDAGAFTDDQGTAHPIDEFPDIAWPRMGTHGGQCPRAEAPEVAMPLVGMRMEDMLGQDLNVFDPFPQRWEFEEQDI